jgi:plastocyanin
MRRALAIALAAAALGGGASAAGAMDGMGGSGAANEVMIAYQAFEPGQIDVLRGATVTWHNMSPRAHTVTSLDGTWGSGALFSGSTFQHQFASAGRFTYICTVHPGMHGEVDAYALLLDSPGGTLASGQAAELTGTADMAPGTPVAIEADSGEGYRHVADTTVRSRGAFNVTLHPTGTASYRAVAAGQSSPPVQLRVEASKVHATAARHGGRATVSVQVTPPAPGSTVVLQVASREHFGWWPTGRARLGRSSRARFVLHTRRRLRMRVLLTLRDGATELARSGTLRVTASR